MEKNFGGNSNKKTRKFGTCSKDCYGSCVYESFWDFSQKNPLLKAVALKSHPFTSGFFCSKYSDRKTLLYHPNRLRSPLQRMGVKGNQNFKEISLEEVISHLTQKIKDLIIKYGPSSIMAASYGGNMGTLSAYSPLRFFHSLGAKFTTGGICNEGGCAGISLLFGTYSLTHPARILDSQTKLIVVWTSNITDNNVHVDLWIKKARKNGAKLIVVDNRKTKIAQIADLFIHINPNTEGLLAFDLFRILLSRNIIDLDFISNRVENFSSFYMKFNNFVNSLKTDNFSASHGISEHLINKFISYLINNQHHTIFLSGYGVQKSYFGGISVQWLVLIQVLLGNIARSGCGFIYSQSDFHKPLKRLVRSIIAPWQNPILKDEIMDSGVELIRLVDALENPELKLLFIYNFNPANSLPNQERLRKVFLRDNLEIIVLDLFLNETTRFADYVIPMKFSEETYDLFFSYYFPSVSINEAGLCPYSDCISIHEFFQQLGIRLFQLLKESDVSINWPKEKFFSASKNYIINQFNHDFSSFSSDEINEIEKLNQQVNKNFKIDEETLYNACLKIIDFYLSSNLRNEGYALFDSLDKIYFKNEPFPTPSGKILINNINFPIIYNEEDSLIKFDKHIGFKAVLLTPNHPKLLHSQLDQINPDVREDFWKCYLSKEDFSFLKNLAEINGKTLNLGDKILLTNQFGKLIYRCSIMSELKKGVVLCYSGGPDRDLAAPNVNKLTPPIPEILGHSGSYNSAKVFVSLL